MDKTVVTLHNKRKFNNGGSIYDESVFKNRLVSRHLR